MNSKSDDEIVNAAASMLLQISDEKVLIDALKEANIVDEYSDKDIIRMHFCLLILNIVIGIHYVNLIGSGSHRSRNIIDALLNRYFQLIEEKYRDNMFAKIRDYIADQNELIKVCNSVGVSSSSPRSATGFSDLAIHTYNIRAQEYAEAIDKRKDHNLWNAGDPIAILLARQYSGDTLPHIKSSVFFTILINYYEKIISEAIALAMGV